MARNYIDGACIACGRTVRIYFVEESPGGKLREADRDDFLDVDVESDLYCDECDPNGVKTESSLRGKAG